jgi:hypothetical protein
MYMIFLDFFILTKFKAGNSMGGSMNGWSPKLCMSRLPNDLKSCDCVTRLHIQWWSKMKIPIAVMLMEGAMLAGLSLVTLVL